MITKSKHVACCEMCLRGSYKNVTVITTTRGNLILCEACFEQVKLQLKDGPCPFHHCCPYDQPRDSKPAAAAAAAR